MGPHPHGCISTKHPHTDHRPGLDQFMPGLRHGTSGTIDNAMEPVGHGMLPNIMTLQHVGIDI